MSEQEKAEELERASVDKNSGFAFHCHHDVLAEYVTDYTERVAYIKRCKPKSEQELRLRLFRLIPEDRLPPEYIKARAEYDKAWAEADKAWAEVDKARAEYIKARAEYATQLGALHRELCPNCPWDGKTIFPMEDK